MDCSNPPIDNTPLEDDPWIVIHINRRDKTCLIRKGNKGPSYPCVLTDWLVDGIMLRDYVDVKYNAVSREWTVVDYHINTEVYGSIHNTYQTDYDDMITDNKGVPL
jgi:hypothetical protein